MKHYGLIGYPLTHSFSERYFTEKFHTEKINASYKRFELHSLDALHELVTHYQLDGFNVTIPHKEKIIPFLHSIDKIAEKIGAVNCVLVNQGKLVGYNTDYIGFEHSLMPLLNSTKVNALIFGNGGAAKAVKYVCTKWKIPFTSVSRNEIQGSITYADLNKEILSTHQLLINTTPIGMFPDIKQLLPLPYQYINEHHIAFDLIYNPEKTLFLKTCEVHNARIKNGYEMLIIQAEESYKIFNKND